MCDADHIGPSESSTVDIENHSKDFALRSTRQSIVISCIEMKLKTYSSRASCQYNWGRH